MEFHAASSGTGGVWTEASVRMALSLLHALHHGRRAPYPLLHVVSTLLIKRATGQRGSPVILRWTKSFRMSRVVRHVS
jgi:hypothetical protein